MCIFSNLSSAKIEDFQPLAVSSVLWEKKKTEGFWGGG